MPKFLLHIGKGKTMPKFPLSIITGNIMPNFLFGTNRQLFIFMLHVSIRERVYLKNENNDRKEQIETIITKVLDIDNENNNLRQSILTLKLTEGSIETIFQTVIQISLLCLALTGKKLCWIMNY